MRTLHFHTLYDLHKSDWHNFKLQQVHMLPEQWIWAAVIVSILFLTAVLLAFFGVPSSIALPYSPYYP
jgi:hypothetical protein